MFELFASRLSRCVVALAIVFAAVAAFVSPASARPHHRHSAERHAYVHHARHHQYRHHARGSRFERSAAQLRASGFADAQASYNPNSAGMANNGMAASGGFGGGSGLVSEARRYLGGNPTGRGRLWCARFMNMVLQHTGHRGTGSDMANSFARYGTRVSGPQVGAIAVMGRRGGGHVGIITGIDAQGNPIMISGNNGNRVREAPISRGRIYAYVMPN